MEEAKETTPGETSAASEPPIKGGSTELNAAFLRFKERAATAQESVDDWLVPEGPYLLLILEQAEKSAGGVILANNEDTMKERAIYKVLAVGGEVNRLEDGSKSLTPILPGARLLVSRNETFDMTLGTMKLTIIHKDGVKARVVKLPPGALVKFLSEGEIPVVELPKVSISVQAGAPIPFYPTSVDRRW